MDTNTMKKMRKISINRKCNPLNELDLGEFVLIRAYSCQLKHLRHTIGYFLLVMTHIDKRYHTHAANGIYQRFKMVLLVRVEALAWFIKDQQVRVFDEGAGQQAQALRTCGYVF